MNSNVVRDDSLGKATVQIGTLEPNQWCRLVERLESGDSGTVELDVFFKPNEHYHLSLKLQQAQDEEKKCLAEAARLAKEVQMAEHARKWLSNVDENTKMPLSLEERDWVRACGGRNMVAPAWITVTQTQVEALVRAREHPHPVALFPEAEHRAARQLQLKVKIIGAIGLKSQTLRRKYFTYCTCEIPQKKESQITTDLAAGDPSPEWRWSRTVPGYVPQDALVLQVYAVEEGDEHGVMPRASELLGRAFLPGHTMYPEGYDGLLNLTLGPRQTGAKLRVTALVVER